MPIPAIIGTVAKIAGPALLQGLLSKQPRQTANQQSQGQSQGIVQLPFSSNGMQRLGQQNYENTRMGMTDNPYYQQFLASQMQLPMMQQPPMQQPMMQSMKRF